MQYDQSLELVRALCQELDNAKVAYCHWKSNAMLDRSASGKNDLDLLIARSDAHRFVSILHQLGFKGADAVPHRRYPGVQHYCGYDAKSDRIVDVHAHFQLVLGNDLLKNYHLPLERAYLDSAVRDGSFKVPAVELEFIVFAIRMMLKRPACRLRRWRQLSASEKQELDYLKSRTHTDNVHKMLRQHLPCIDSKLFTDCLRCIEEESSGIERMRTGRQLRRALRSDTRYPWFVAFALRTIHWLTPRLRAKLGGSWSRRQLKSGGTLIAIVGGDGAGKSTMVHGLYEWLSRDWNTRTVHLGKPPKSHLTRLVIQLIRADYWINRLLLRRHQDHQPSTLESTPEMRPLRALRYLCIARDRFHTFLNVRRFTSNGGIAVCDRFPLQQVKQMEGPGIHLPPEAQHSKERFHYTVMRFLAQIEAKYYAQIHQPDQLIVLRVPPKIAVERKPTEEPTSVRARSQEIWELDWENTCAHVVDASRPQEQVLSELKRLIWSEL